MRHVIELRKRLPGLDGADIILIPESNTGLASGIYCTGLIEHQVPRVFLLDEDEKHSGLRTDNAGKKRMVVLFSAAMHSKIVKFHPLLVSTTGDPAAMKAMMIEQLAGFKRKRKIRKVSGDDDGQVQYTEIYTGKMGHRKDDHAMGVMINYVGRTIYMQKYETNYRNKQPLWRPASS